MEILQLILKIILHLALFAAAVWDIKQRRIPIIFLAAVSACGITLQLILCSLPLWDVLLGCLVGALLAVISLISRQSIGLGDSLMFVVSGIFLGITGNLWLALFSFSGAALCSLILVIFKKVKWKSSIPFLPFMFLGNIILQVFT